MRIYINQNSRKSLKTEMLLERIRLGLLHAIIGVGTVAGQVCFGMYGDLHKASLYSIEC